MGRGRSCVLRAGQRLALAGALLLPGCAPAGAEAVCFTAADNARLGFQVLQNAAPPTEARAAAYAYYPLTGAASMQLRAVQNGAPGYATYYFQWANRSNARLANAAGHVIPRKANLQPSAAGMRKQRSAFTGTAKANACTLAQTASVLGLEPRARVFAGEAGIRLVSERDQPDVPPLGPDDTCVIPTGRLAPAATGVLLDYEVQDGRTPRDTLAFLTQWAKLVHGAGRKAILLVNPLDAPTQAYTGLSRTNAHAIVDLFDLTTIQLWSRNSQGDIAASYAAQKAMIAAGGPFDGRRVLIQFELAGTTLEDARQTRAILVADRLAGVMFWRNEAQQGGDCSSDVNRKIAAIAFGDPRRTSVEGHDRLPGGWAVEILPRLGGG